MISSCELRQVDRKDIPHIVELVNLAYRSQEYRGWTSEADIVKGNRTTNEQINALLDKQNSHLLLMQHHERLIGCVHLQKHGQSCDIGMLTIHPQWQDMGMGKVLLKRAEEFAIKQFEIQFLEMSVLSVREELLQFYQRRGYHLTGRSETYPYEANVGTPLQSNIQVLKLLKPVY